MIWRNSVGAVAVLALGLGLAPAASAASAEGGEAGGIPDFTGPWNNGNAFKLIPVPGSPKPVDDLAGYVHHERGVDANGKDYSTNAYIGDYKNSLLTPWAQAILKKEAEDAIKDKDPFWPATFCFPFGPTMLLQPEPVAFLQEKDKITLFYQRDHQVRHVYLNVPHSKTVKPSWYGESVGHYEGDTLVVDTVGFNGKTTIDRYGVPYSEQLHLIERYRMAPDGMAMQAEVTYDDPKAYTAQWKALIRYRKGRAMPEETACAESPLDPVTGEMNPIPVAQKADF